MAEFPFGWSALARVFAATMLIGLVAACATPPTDPEERAVYEETNDPLEPLNRAIFDFNLVVDKAILRPVAQAYEWLLPQLVRDSVRSFVRHLKTPVILANDLLQGEVDRAGETAGRFVFNSLAGIGGIFDVAGEAGIPYHEEDFGQTLAVWGFDDGAFLMLPILGPSSVRDGFGMHVVDRGFDPLNYASYNSDRFVVEYNGPIRGFVEAVDTRSRNYRDLEELEESSLDFYAAVRSLYRQQRTKLISNGEADNSAVVPSLNFEMEFDEEEEDQAEIGDSGDQISLNE